LKNIDIHLHDIGNIVLTENNSNYQNFDFVRKKGHSGQGYCYANSDIRQERKIANYLDWTVVTCKERKVELATFIQNRWGIEQVIEDLELDVNEDENEE
jgi:hypothetical protein